METKRWTAGEGSKSDCAASYAAGSKPLSVAVRSSVGALFGKAIAETASRVAADFGAATGILELDDDGALDFVVAARAEAVLRMAGFARIGSKPTVPVRAEVASAILAKDRPRRSRLYLPGNQPHLAINAGLFGADCLILDLEDSVVPERKFEARILVRRTLESSLMLGDCEIIVRINPLSGPFGLDDLVEILPAKPHVILLPKCESAGDIAGADKVISDLEQEAGIPHGSIFLMPLVETARGVLAAGEIATASSRNVALCFGREDFSRDIGSIPYPDGTASVGGSSVAGAFGGVFVAGIESLLARQMIVLAARAAGIAPLDSVYADVENTEGLERSCYEARALGFSGKGVVHPLQISVVRRCFRPTEEERSAAERIITAFEASVAEGHGAISVDGKMVDAPVAEKARRLLDDFPGDK